MSVTVGAERRIAVAAHSIRAVPLEQVAALAAYARDRRLPFHMHVAEQRRELAECQDEHGTTPVELLARRGVLDERFVAIHATHLTSGEIVPLKPWLWMSEWVFRDYELAATYGPVALAAVVTVVVVMVCGPWARALGPELRRLFLASPAYPGLVFDPFTSIFRYLLPLFPLIVVLLGGGWADRRPRFLGWRTGALVAAGVVGQVIWVFELLVFVPPSDYPP